MVAIRKHAPADATAESLALDEGGASAGGPRAVCQEAIQERLIESQLEMKVQLNTMQSQLDLLVAHLIRPTK